MTPREMILNNIRGEIRAFLRNSKPLPKRDSRWDVDIAMIMVQEKRELEEEQKAEIEMMYQTYYLRHISGLTYEEWLDKSKKLYRIDADFTVYSIAWGPDKERVWANKSLKAAHKRIIKLIAYKRVDHFIKGHDFAYDPDN